MFSAADTSASAAPAGERAIDLVIVTCPRCGHVDRMLASSYALWRDGILCGLCGPPYVKMYARAVESGRP